MKKERSICAGAPDRHSEQSHLQLGDGLVDCLPPLLTRTAEALKDRPLRQAREHEGKEATLGGTKGEVRQCRKRYQGHWNGRATIP